MTEVQYKPDRNHAEMKDDESHTFDHFLYSRQNLLSVI